MNYIAKNLIFLIRQTGLGKDAFGETVGLKRGNIGSYIDEKALPKIDTLQKISDTYQVSLDDLVNKDLTNNNFKPRNKDSNKGLSSYSVAQIIENMYLRDDEFTSSGLLWMYMKLKILDGQVSDEKLIVERLQDVAKRYIEK